MYNIKTYNNIAKEGLNKLSPEKYLIDQDGQADAILIRSQDMFNTEYSEDILAIGRAGAGVNNIPLEQCTNQGIVVFNTPGANANAVKELVLASLFMASRPIINGVNWVKTLNVTDGDLNKTVEGNKKMFVGGEILNKKLGVIGLGAIGAMVANDAYRLGMDVIGYDPYVSVDTAWNISSRIKRVTNLEELLSTCDYISIHVPLLKQTKDTLNATNLKSLKQDAVILNFSRGELINDDAIIEKINDGTLRYYITDFISDKLINNEKVVILPHLGASTNEAEINCAKMAARTVRNFLETGNIINSVNLPHAEMNIKTPLRITLIHENIPNMLGSISTALSSHNINIVNMINKSRDNIAYTMVDLDFINDDLLLDIEESLINIKGMIRIRNIKTDIEVL